MFSMTNKIKRKKEQTLEREMCIASTRQSVIWSRESDPWLLSPSLSHSSRSVYSHVECSQWNIFHWIDRKCQWGGVSTLLDLNWAETEREKRINSTRARFAHKSVRNVWETFKYTQKNYKFPTSTSLCFLSSSSTTNALIQMKAFPNWRKSLRCFFFFLFLKIPNPSQREGMAWNVLHLLVCKYSAVLSDYQLWMIFHSHPFLKWDLSFVSGPEKGQLWRVLEQSRRTINYVNAHILNGSYFSWPVIKTTLLRM